MLDITALMLHAAATSSRTSMVLSDAAGRAVWVNAAFCELSGYSVEQALGQRLNALLAGPDTDPATLESLARGLAMEQPVDTALLVYRQSGESFWSRLRCEPIIGSSGALEGWFRIDADITAVRQSEAAAGRAQSLLVEAQRLSRMGSWEWRIEGDVVEWSDELFTLYGLDPSHGAPAYAEHASLMEPESFSRLGMAVQSAITTGAPYDLPDLRIIRQDGTRRVGAAKGEVIRDRNGSIVGLRGTLQDVTEAFEAERHRCDLEERLQLALESSGDGVYDWDMVAGSVSYSARWKQMLGYADQEIGDSPEEWSSRVHPDDLPVAMMHVEAHLRRESPSLDVDMPMRRKDGSWHWVRSRGKVVARTASGEPARFVGTHLDIQTEKDAEASLRHARDAAEAATRAKSEFLARMSHELRTPLNSIIGFSRLVHSQCGTLLGPTHALRLERVVANGKHLLALINDILDLSKVEAQRMPVELGDVSVARLIDEVRSMLEPLTPPNVTLHMTPISESLIIVSDYGKLTQLLVNIIGNALKFTQEGWVRVNIDTSDDALIITVSDTGPGIPQHRLEAIFEAFEQGNGSTHRTHGGTGLGLTISRSLVALLGGTLTVHSTRDAGATFCITLPRVRPRFEALAA
jgi:PAS domain S-box-containing protein